MPNLIISDQLELPENEFELSAIRAGGPGGQNVNKVNSAIHLRFDINASSLPEPIKNRLLQRKDSRVTRNGIIVIKAMQHRTQEKNRRAACERLIELIQAASMIRKPRKPTRPSRASKLRRLDSKSRRSKLKQSRSKIIES